MMTQLDFQYFTLGLPSGASARLLARGPVENRENGTGYQLQVQVGLRAMQAGGEYRNTSLRIPARRRSIFRAGPLKTIPIRWPERPHGRFPKQKLGPGPPRPGISSANGGETCTTTTTG